MISMVMRKVACFRVQLLHWKHMLKISITVMLFTAKSLYFDRLRCYEQRYKSVASFVVETAISDHSIAFSIKNMHVK